MSGPSKPESLRAAKGRYAKAQDDARRQAAINLAVPLGLDFTLLSYSNRALRAIDSQWDVDPHPHPDQRFDWPSVTGSFQGFKTLTVAAWIPGNPERLAALGLASVEDNYVTLRCIEGDPRPDCPLKGRRALVMIETAVCYAQALGKVEVRLIPANDNLRELYEKTYGFALESSRKGAPYYWYRRV